MPTDPQDEHWREAPSVVTAVKSAYRIASQRQRQMIRAWIIRKPTPRSSGRLPSLKPMVQPPQPVLIHWIDVQDHLPDDEITVLVHRNDGEIFTAYHLGESWLHSWTDCPHTEITHWCDLPVPPSVPSA